MKKLVTVLVLSFLMIPFFTISAEKKDQKTIVKSPQVEVYYFHFTRRCITCQAVETESKKAVETLYPEQIKKGLITFKSINLDEESSASLAKK